MYTHFMPILSDQNNVEGLLDVLHLPLTRWVNRHISYVLDVLEEAHARGISRNPHNFDVETFTTMENAFRDVAMRAARVDTRKDLRRVALDLRALEREYVHEIDSVVTSISWYQVFEEMLKPYKRAN